MKTPPWIKNSLKKFGTSLYGHPIYRLIWSEDSMEWRNGEMRPKYGAGKNRWVIEKWCPPEMYGDRTMWEAPKTDDGKSALGPFPNEGAYEHCYTLDYEGEESIGEPPCDLVDLICRCIEAGRMYTRTERFEALREAMKKQQRADDAVFEQLWEDCKPAPGAKLPDHIERMDSFDVNRVAVNDIPLPLPRKSGFSQVTMPEEEK
jgi:hypothetical protein